MPDTQVPYLHDGFVELIEHMGSDRSIAEAAWVSSDRAENRDDAAVARLIRYLAEHEHWTPFGQAQVRLRFRIPIFIARQLMRSNIGIVWNEESRRYVDSEPVFHIPKDGEWRCRSDSMKQGSEGVFKGTVFDELPAPPTESFEDLLFYVTGLYNAMLKAGIAPEQARMVLPLSTYTTIVGSFTLAALARVYKLRIDPHAQLEIQQLAGCIDTLVAPLFPVAWAELKG